MWHLTGAGDEKISGVVPAVRVKQDQRWAVGEPQDVPTWDWAVGEPQDVPVRLINQYGMKKDWSRNMESTWYKEIFYLKVLILSLEQPCPYFRHIINSLENQLPTWTTLLQQALHTCGGVPHAPPLT